MDYNYALDRVGRGSERITVNQNAVLLSVDPEGRILGRWGLGEQTVTFGRAPENGIVLDDREVSRCHGELRPDGGTYVLVDRGSKNGLTLNGRRLEAPTRLVDGDEIRIAPQFRLIYFDNEATLPSRKAAPFLSLDPATRVISLGSRRLDPPLAVAQFAALALLYGAPGQVFSRDQLAAACYPDAKGGVSDQAIDGVMRRLRQRLTELEPGHDFIVAHRGFGFTLRPRVE